VSLSLKWTAGPHTATPLTESLGDQRLSLLSRFGRRGIVLLTLGLVGPCGVGGAAAGSSTGVMALRFLLGFLLAGVDLGVYLMREWHPSRAPSLGAHACLSVSPGHCHCSLGPPQSLLQLSGILALSGQAFKGSRGLASHTPLSFPDL
jgi:MFS family permease